MADKTPRKTPPDKAKKRPWQSPRIKTGQLFESNSLACGKVPGTGESQCEPGEQNPKIS